MRWHVACSILFIQLGGNQGDFLGLTPQEEKTLSQAWSIAEKFPRDLFAGLPESNNFDFQRGCINVLKLINDIITNLEHDSRIKISLKLLDKIKKELHVGRDKDYESIYRKITTSLKEKMSDDLESDELALLVRVIDAINEKMPLYSADPQPKPKEEESPKKKGKQKGGKTKSNLQRGKNPITTLI